jgi:hypothetical protein
MKRRHYTLRQESEFWGKTDHKIYIIASILIKLYIMSHFAGIPAVPQYYFVHKSIVYGYSVYKLTIDKLALYVLGFPVLFVH